MKQELVTLTTDAVKKMHTSCQNCAFAVYDGYTQTDCKLGRIEAFRREGEVLEATDDKEEFFIINGRICNARRGDKWLWENNEDPVQRVRKELSVKLAVLVVAEDGATDEDVEKTVLAVANQSIAPTEVFLVNNRDGVGNERLAVTGKTLLGNKFTWRITRVFERDEEGNKVGRGKVVDLAVDQIKASNWYAVFLAGFTPPKDYIETLNRALNERLLRFTLLTPLSCGNGLVAQVAFHAHPMVCGNTPVTVEMDPKATGFFVPEGEPPSVRLKDLVDKVFYYSLLHDQPYMVRTAQEVMCS